MSETIETEIRLDSDDFSVLFNVLEGLFPHMTSF